MTILKITVNQMGVLFALLLAGFLLARRGVLPEDTETVLARLGNHVFMPATVLRAFVENFTPDRLSTMWGTFAAGTAVILVMIPIASLVARRCTDDPYLRNIYAYLLAFSNFGFVGNAIVSAVFPDIYMDYLMFTMPLWVMINFWGIPHLLIPEDAVQQRRGGRLRALLNPIFLAMIAGVLISLSGLRLPAFLLTAVTVSEGCAFPVSMLLVGTIAAGMDCRKVVFEKSLYIVLLFRLLLFPLAFAALSFFVHLPEAVVVCAVCCLAMPMGTTTVIVPGSYGKDTTMAAGLAIFSHLFSGITVPLVFFIMSMALGIG